MLISHIFNIFNFLSSIYEQSVYELDMYCKPVFYKASIPVSGHTRPVYVLTRVDGNLVVLQLHISCRVISQHDEHFKFCFKLMIFNRTMLLSFIGEVVIKANFPSCSVSFPQKFGFAFPIVCSKK